MSLANPNSWHSFNRVTRVQASFDRTQDTDRVRPPDHQSDLPIGEQIDFLAGTTLSYIHAGPATN